MSVLERWCMNMARPAGMAGGAVPRSCAVVKGARSRDSSAPITAGAPGLHTSCRRRRGKLAK